MIDTLTADKRYTAAPAGSINFGDEKWAILLLNMGGPQTLDDVDDYLYNIFTDPVIIELPLSRFLQKPLARMICKKRAPLVKKQYQAIGGGSPLLQWTELTGEGLQRILHESYPQLSVYVGMRYTPPEIQKQMESIAAVGCRHVLLLPLYPQYCKATTGTAIGEVCRWLKKSSAELSVSLVHDWHDHPAYLKLLRENITAALNKTDGKQKSKVLFSAHSLPDKLVRQGDPYVDQVRQTVAFAGAGFDYELSFQSRSGPVKWVGPQTAETIKRLGKEGVRELVIVPVSFVSDHIETMYEIDVKLRRLAELSGIEKFVRTDSFNDDPRFIHLLADLVRQKITVKAGQTT